MGFMECPPLISQPENRPGSSATCWVNGGLADAKVLIRFTTILS
jgi:hypothetical protein